MFWNNCHRGFYPASCQKQPDRDGSFVRYIPLVFVIWAQVGKNILCLCFLFCVLRCLVAVQENADSGAGRSGCETGSRIGVMSWLGTRHPRNLSWTFVHDDVWYMQKEKRGITITSRMVFWMFVIGTLVKK